LLKLLVLVISLWAVYLIRAHNTLVLPVFVDESLHILRAQVVFDFSDAVASFLPGKLLLYYYLGLFRPENDSGLWLSRQAVALIAPLSAALCYAIAFTFTRSFRAGILVIWLYASSPLMIFFERMALADTFALGFALGLVWISILAARYPTRTRRILCGLLLGLALLAKLTALPLVVVPVLAMRLLGNWSPRLLVVTYAVALLITLLPSGYSVYQEVNPPEKKGEIVEASLYIPEDRSRLRQIEHNAGNYAEALWAFGAAIPLVIALTGLVFQPRVGFFLLVIVALGWGFVIVVTAFPTTRYLTLTFPLILVSCGVMLHQLEAQQTLFYGLAVALLMFGLWQAGFITDAWNDPTQHTLGDQDEWEYFRHKSSSYAVREAAADIFRMDDAPLIAGFVGSCHSLRLYGSNESDYLFCPMFRFYDNPAIALPEVWLEAFQARGEAYALVEVEGEAIFAEYGFDAQFLGTYPRPHDGESLNLYRISP
jgi:hypothetical protein